MSQVYSLRKPRRRVVVIRNSKLERDIEELSRTLASLSDLQSEVAVWILQLADDIDKQMKTWSNVGHFGNAVYFSGALISLVVPWLRMTGIVWAVTGRCVSTTSDIAKMVIEFLADSKVKKRLDEHTAETRRALQLIDGIQKSCPHIINIRLGESYSSAYNNTIGTRSGVELFNRNWDTLLLALLAYAGSDMSVGLTFSSMSAGYSLYNRVDMSKGSDTGNKLRQLARELRDVTEKQDQMRTSLELLLDD